MEKRQGSYCSRWLNESLLFLNPHFAPVNLRKLISVSVRLPPTTPIEVCPFLARYSMTDWAAMRLLNRNTAITAIFAMSDLIAHGTMRAIYDMGKRVPEDISIVGYDGIALSRYCVPRLTTVQQDTTQLAKKGVDLMLQRINYPYHATLSFIVL